MTGGARLPAPYGVRIERDHPVTFTFDGAEYTGCRGDSVASALLANDVWLIGRSFKYHRPRSVLSLTRADSNLYVTVDGVPNQPAERLGIAPGMKVDPQNFKGSLKRDRWATTGWFSRFLPVGFYYWTFYRPKGVWRHWEKLIRARAGLGRLDPGHRWRTRAKAYDWADVVVIGGGESGSAAARAAAATGAEVLLVDEGRGQAATDAMGFRVRQGCAVHGIYGDGWIAATEQGRLLKIRAAQIVVATGALQQPAVFRNNDLPGILLGTAVEELTREYAVRIGEKVVVVTSGRDGYEAAATLMETGGYAVTIVDRRSEPGPEAGVLVKRGAKLLSGHIPVAAVGTTRVRGLRVRALNDGGAEKDLPCDIVASCGGGVPDAALWCHAGGRLTFDRAASSWRLSGDPDRLVAAGAVRGFVDHADCVADGEWAGQTAAARAGFGDAPSTSQMVPPASGQEPIIVPHPRGHEFVDVDEDLTIKDLQAAVAQGFDHVQLLKRYSTLGMGPSQGRHALGAASEIAATARGDDPKSVGTTTFRPPLHGLPFDSLAGDAFHPERRTPMDGWHRENGAEMMVAGAWWRPAYYGKPGDAMAAALREARAVREAVGLIDVSTLGKIEIRGPDAAAFLERFYTFRYAKQPVGRSRYLLATDETGAIVDDGVACRLTDDHFYVTTTTGTSDQIYRTMLWWNIYWRFDVDITNVTGAYAALNIAGPLSRKALARAAALDVGKEAFPYLAVRIGEVAGVHARILRVGFVGELGFEIHVPAGFGAHVWASLMDAGRDEGLVPFGVEAQRLLRLEKGHIIVGQDTDGLTFPREVGMDWAVAQKPDFVGKRSIDIHNKRGIDRILVGFRLAEGEAPVEEGELTIRDGAIAGRVTSSGTETGSGRSIGLAYVDPGDAEPGTQIEIKRGSGRKVAAEVVALPFYDPENERQEVDP